MRIVRVGLVWPLRYIARLGGAPTSASSEATSCPRCVAEVTDLPVAALVKEFVRPLPETGQDPRAQVIGVLACSSASRESRRPIRGRRARSGPQAEFRAASGPSAQVARRRRSSRAGSSLRERPDRCLLGYPAAESL